MFRYIFPCHYLNQCIHCLQHHYQSNQNQHHFHVHLSILISSTTHLLVIVNFIISSLSILRSSSNNNSFAASDDNMAIRTYIYVKNMILGLQNIKYALGMRAVITRKAYKGVDLW